MITVGLVSLGCAKNLVDSEVMLGQLRRKGFNITLDPAASDVVVVNTCGFLQEAKDEGYETIREMARLKDEGRLKRLVVAGCMVQRFSEEMHKKAPEVDRFVGLNDVERIVEACDLSDEEFLPDLSPATYIPRLDAGRILATTGVSAYLKISEGCDNPCAFCIIPEIRGRFRSRPVMSLVDEAKSLAESGVQEINLIAQDSTSYGIDIGETGGLPELLRSLNRVADLKWIRILYAYPSKVTTELMDTIAASQRVVDYIDIPLQHAARRVLMNMRRGGSSESFLRMLGEFRKRVPGISLRTTMIVGHPGETEEDVRELLNFVAEAQFDHLGVFMYSHEPGTASHDFVDDVPAEEKQERRDRVMTLQQEISLERYSARIGTTQEVLIDAAPEEPGAPFRGRAAFQAPDIDGSVLVSIPDEFENKVDLPVGGFFKVRITGAEHYDLLAEPLELPVSADTAG